MTHHVNAIERKLYSAICTKDGLKAKDIGKITGESRSVINHYLYSSPYIKELCYQDQDFCWHGLIRQTVPHLGMEDFCGYYGMVNEFLDTDFEDFFVQLKQGCHHIGRNLNDTRGLFHSFEDTYHVMQEALGSLIYRKEPGHNLQNWEIGFELRIKRSRHIRIYADVILVADQKVFSLEFKMKDKALPEDVEQAAKYSEYLEVIFGVGYDVIPTLVLSGGEDIYGEEELKDSTAMIPVCSGDRLEELIRDYNILDEDKKGGLNV